MNCGRCKLTGNCHFEMDWTHDGKICSHVVRVCGGKYDDMVAERSKTNVRISNERVNAADGMDTADRSKTGV
jgi:hypothetical protein